MHCEHIDYLVIKMNFINVAEIYILYYCSIFFDRLMRNENKLKEWFEKVSI